MEINEIIKYLSENLVIEVESECAMYDESASVKVTLKIDDVIISESSASIFTE